MILNMSVMNPTVKSIIVRKEAIESEDYDKFVEQVHKDLSYQISQLQGYAANFYNKSEDDITIFLVSNLKSMGYLNTHHDVFNNGHVDIYIEDNYFKWLGECKLQKGNEYSNEGFKQLSTRYSDGHENSNRGGILIYNQLIQKKTLTCMTEWNNFLATDLEFQKMGMKCEPIDVNSGKQYFDSEHIHEKSGMPYKIRHFFVNLMHNPKDHLKEAENKNEQLKPRKRGRPKKNLA